MRRLNERNKTYVYYSLYKGVRVGRDESLYTGENIPYYSLPVKARMVVGLTTGLAALEQFGITDGYAVKVVTDETDCPVDTASVFWLCLGDLPVYDSTEQYITGDVVLKDGYPQKYDSSTQTWSGVPYTHIVQRVSKSFGYITYLLKDVEVSGEINYDNSNT